MYQYVPMTINVFHLAKNAGNKGLWISAICAVTAYLKNRHYILALKIY